MALVKLFPVEDSHLQLLDNWLRKEHVIKWYNDADEWLYEIRARNAEFSFLHHYIVYVDDKPIGFGQWYDCFEAKEDWYTIEKPNHLFSIDYFIGDELFLRKGFGRTIVGELVGLIRNQNSEAKIVVQPDLENVSSANVLIANGFTYDANCRYFIL